MKCSVFIATSLDGFIARNDGGIDWLPGFESGEDYGFSAFMRSVDGMVMGRHTYELVAAFGTWPYGRTPVTVLTTRGVAIPETLAATVTAMSATPHEVVQQLAERGMNRLSIDGGKTIQGFLAEGLITDMVITRIPVLIGTGIPLFGPLPADIPWRHTATSTYPNGLVQSRYDVNAGGNE